MSWGTLNNNPSMQVIGIPGRKVKETEQKKHLKQQYLRIIFNINDTCKSHIQKTQKIWRKKKCPKRRKNKRENMPKYIILKLLKNK